MTIWERRRSAGLEIEDFPAIVVIDSQGSNLYETAAEEYRRTEDEE